MNGSDIMKFYYLRYCYFSELFSIIEAALHQQNFKLLEKTVSKLGSQTDGG